MKTYWSKILFWVSALTTAAGVVMMAVGGVDHTILLFAGGQTSMVFAGFSWIATVYTVRTMSMDEAYMAGYRAGHRRGRRGKEGKGGTADLRIVAGGRQ